MRVGFLAFALVGCVASEAPREADEADGVGTAASLGPADREDEDDDEGTALAEHASVPASHRDEFRQDGAWGATDVVLWTDGSGTMADDRDRLDAAAGAFTSVLNESAGDWQILAVDDSGCGEILEPGDAPFSAVEQGSPGFEGGLAAIAAAMEETAAGGCNAGFLRPEAKTLVVVVSDEPEQSGFAWDELIGVIDDYATSLTISAIGGDLPQGCATAAPARGYAEAVELTGGVFVSICSEDLVPGVESVASTAANVDLADTFTLSGPANPATLTVLVGGVPSTAWTYDAASNALTFAEPPAAGSEIVALYQEPPRGP